MKPLADQGSANRLRNFLTKLSQWEAPSRTSLRTLTAWPGVKVLSRSWQRAMERLNGSDLLWMGKILPVMSASRRASVAAS